MKLPGKRDGRRKTDSKEKTEEKNRKGTTKPKYSISPLFRTSQNYVLETCASNVMNVLNGCYPVSMLLSLTIADRHLTCNEVFIT
jgi:hypothetical protein